MTRHFNYLAIGAGSGGIASANRAAQRGAAAARALRGEEPTHGLPVLLFGNSRGTMSSGWAMTSRSRSLSA